MGLVGLGAGHTRGVWLAGQLVSFVMSRPKNALLQCTNIEPGVWGNVGRAATAMESLVGVHLHTIEQSQLI